MGATTTKLGAVMVGTMGVMVSVLTAAEPARACSCIFPHLSEALPEDGDVDVPLNVRALIPRSVPGSGDAAELPAELDLELVTPDGVAVPVTTGRLTAIAWNGELHALLPAQPLEPGVTYSVRSPDPEGGVTVFHAFTTGEVVDVEPPAVPTVAVEVTHSSVVRSEPPPPCGGTSHYVQFSFESEGVLNLITQMPEAFDEATLSGTVLDIFPGVDTAPNLVSYTAGSSICRATWPEARGGASSTFYFGTLDAAGNFSGWSEPFEVTLPPTEVTNLIENPRIDDGGCRCVRGADERAAAPVGAMLLLGATLVRPARRRLRSPTSARR